MKIHLLNGEVVEREVPDYRCRGCGWDAHEGDCPESHLVVVTMLRDGRTGFEYDPQRPCDICNKPVLSASSSGTTICPWCDTGSERKE